MTATLSSRLSFCKGEFILETRQKIFSAMAGKLDLNFGVIGWCWQDSLAGENSNLIFPPWHYRFFWQISNINSTLMKGPLFHYENTNRTQNVQQIQDL